MSKFDCGLNVIEWIHQVATDSIPFTMKSKSNSDSNDNEKNNETTELEQHLNFLQEQSLILSDVMLSILILVVIITGINE